MSRLLLIVRSYYGCSSQDGLLHASGKGVHLRLVYAEHILKHHHWQRWTWGWLSPPLGGKSMRAMDRPCVLSPGKVATEAKVTMATLLPLLLRWESLV